MDRFFDQYGMFVPFFLFVLTVPLVIWIGVRNARARKKKPAERESWEVRGQMKRSTNRGSDSGWIERTAKAAVRRKRSSCQSDPA